MSYIPKYILKRMIPVDALKAVDGGAELTFINVISPLTLDEIPADVTEKIDEYVEITVDGTPLTKAEMEKISIRAVAEGLPEKSFTLANAKEIEGFTIPVGGKLFITVPSDKIKKGQTHEISVLIRTDNPFSFKVERECK